MDKKETKQEYDCALCEKTYADNVETEICPDCRAIRNALKRGVQGQKLTVENS